MKLIQASLLSVLLSCAIVAGAQERSIPLRNLYPEVEAKYQSIQFLSREELRETLGTMKPTLAADVWTVHILSILRAHPEFTAAQRSLIYEALGLIVSGSFEIDRASREWTDQARPTLLDLTTRVNAAFPADIARALMLDPRDPVMTLLSPGNRRDSRGLIKSQGWEWCYCSIYYGTDCQFANCVDAFPPCMAWFGCGPWGWDACDGVCR